MRLSIARPETYQRRLVQVVGAALTLAVAIWLGYAFGRGQSLADVARLYRDANRLDYTIDNGQLAAVFERTGGDLKPGFRAPDGTLLMDYSDWDYSSIVVVDGERFEFVRLVPSTSVDYARERIVEGLETGEWVLSREIQLQGADAQVDFTFTAKKPVHDVQIIIAHANWYFLGITPKADGFVATVPHASRQEVETGVIHTPSYEVTLKGSAPRPLGDDFVRVGLTTPYGVQSVTTQYRITDPPVGDYVPVGSEHLSWRKL